ncbi:uncharacterized protein LOC123524357 [Mercenaria mercenaria]|uniref:uncharacterized protein LOC123524357 n=1 Tax=Mercenaria mercenaria TaxID=6596 RepID=UPI001E1D7AC3|nr:uncharacterized protein LOC123524357 [Mercenaria mercenaria]
MFLLIFYMLQMLLLSTKAQHSTESAEEVACPSCMHMTFELRNMPAMYKIMLQNILSNMNLQNPECEENTVEPETCEAPMYPAWIENRCLSTHVTLHAVGITGILPDAEMDVTVLVRGCHAQWIGEASGCTNLADLDADTQAQMTQQLAQVRDAWETVTYTGEVCIL